LRIALAAAVIAGLSACGEHSTSPSRIGSSSGSSSSGGTPPIGTVTFSVDGVQHTVSRVTATYSGGILEVNVSDAAQQTTIGFAVTGVAPATYQIGPFSPTSAQLLQGNPERAWQAVSSVGSGSVTLTMFSPITAVGTFIFTLEPVTGTGATGTRRVTDGAFNVTIR
jgi:hypothetical protein